MEYIMDTPEARFLRWDLADRVIDDMEQALTNLIRTQNDVRAWRRVFQSLDSALYTTALYMARGHDTNSVKNADGHVVGFWKALEYCQDKGRVGGHCPDPLSLSSEQEQAIKTLHNEIRNELEHPGFDLWSICIEGAEEMVLEVLGVIKFISIDAGSYLVFMDHEKKKRVSTLLDGCIAIADSQKRAHMFAAAH